MIIRYSFKNRHFDLSVKNGVFCCLGQEGDKNKMLTLNRDIQGNNKLDGERREGGAYEPTHLNTSSLSPLKEQVRHRRL